MKKAYAIIICVVVVSILLGSSVISFANIERAVEGVEASSDTLLLDLSSITLFAFTASDFFSGADYFDLRLLAYQDVNGNLTGEAKLVYESSRFVRYADDGAILTERVRYEELPLFAKGSGKTLGEMENAFDRIKYPIKGFIDNERKTYSGAFSAVLNAVQFIAYVCMMIYAVLCIIVLILIDTVGIAWALVHAMLKILGLG